MIDKVEKLARIIAGAMTGLDPDTRVALGEPAHVSGLYGYMIPAGEFLRPLWAAYSWAARSALDAGFDCSDEPTIEQVPNDESAVIDESPAESQPASEAVAWDKVDRPLDEAKVEAWRERMGLA